MTDIHARDRDIPAGKVLICEYRDKPADDPLVEFETLATRMAWNGRREVSLTARMAGWACAGSMMRWDNGAVGVLWEFDGSRHGRWFKSHDDARAFFDGLPE